MTCRICKKHACCESFHSLEEQAEFEDKQEAEKALAKGKFIPLKELEKELDND